MIGWLAEIDWLDSAIAAKVKPPPASANMAGEAARLETWEDFALLLREENLALA